MADPKEVQLIGVFQAIGQDHPMPNDCGFVYSVNRPVENLWVSQQCTDGTYAGHEVMAMGLNQLIRDDAALGDSASVEMDGGYSLRFLIGDVLDPDADDVQAFQATLGRPVRLVSIEVVR